MAAVKTSLCILGWKNTEIRDGCCFLWGAELSWNSWQWNTFSKIKKWDQTGQQVASYWEVVGSSVIACLPNTEVINKTSDLLKLLQERNWKQPIAQGMASMWLGDCSMNTVRDFNLAAQVICLLCWTNSLPKQTGCNLGEGGNCILIINAWPEEL